MFCGNCGKELKEGSVFCSACGSRLDEAGNPIQNNMAAQNFGTDFQSGISNRKSMLTKVGIGVAGVAVVAGIGSGIFLNQPKAKVLRGAEKTFSAMLEEESGIADYIGLKKLIEQVGKGASSQELTGSMGVYGQQAGVKVELNSDVKNKEFFMRLAPIYSDMELTEAFILTDKNRVSVAVPDLYDGVFYANNEKFLENLADSKIGKMLEDEGVEIPDGQEDEKNIKELTEFWERYEKASKQEWKELSKAITVKKSGSKTVSIGGKSKKCTGYDVVIPRRELRGVIKGFSSFVRKDDGLKAVMSVDEAYYDQAMREFGNACNQLEDMIRDDLEFTVYTGSKGRLVSLEATIESEFASADVEVILAGKKNPLDSFECEISSGSSSVILTREMKDSKKRIEDVMEFGDMSYTMEFDKNSGDWSIELEADRESIVVEGTLTEVKKGKSLSLTVDEIEAPGMSGTELSGSYKISPLKGSVGNLPELSEQINVLELGRKEIEDIGTDIEENIQDKMKELDLGGMASSF